jgi:FxsC-like protein
VDRTGTARQIVVALVAGTSNRMRQLRHSVEAYGDTPEDWCPFVPQSSEPAISVVGRTLRACGLDGAQFVQLDADRPVPRLRNDDAAAVMMVVDPWMTDDASFPVLWERLAECEVGVSAVILVLPRHDTESRANATRLRDSFARTPARLLGAAHHEVGTPQALAHAVAGVLADVATEEGGESGSEGGGERDGPPRPLVESSAERRSRRRRERAEWLTPVAAQRASLVGGATGKLWSDG